MRVRLQRHLSDSPQQLHKRRLARQIRPQHQRVYEEPYQRFNLDVIPSRYGRAYDYVLLPRVALEQRVEACQQRHKQCCAFLLPQLPEPVG